MKAQHFDTTAFSAVAKVYEELLAAIDNAGESGTLGFEIEALEKQEAFLKGYVEKQFKDFSPDKQKGDQLRCAKPVVCANVSETHYRYQSMSIKLNQFNGKLWELMHTPGPNQPAMNQMSSQPVVEDAPIGNGVDGDDVMGNGAVTDEPALNGYGSENPTDDMMSGVDDGIMSGDEEIMEDPAQKQLEDSFKKLKVGAVEKIFRLRYVICGESQQLKFGRDFTENPSVLMAI